MTTATTLENTVTVFDPKTRSEVQISLSDLIDQLQAQVSDLPQESWLDRKWNSYWSWRKQERQQVIEKYLDQFVLLYQEAEEVLGHLSIQHFIDAFGNDLGYTGFLGGPNYRRARRWYWILRSEMISS